MKTQRDFMCVFVSAGVWFSTDVCLLETGGISSFFLDVFFFFILSFPTRLVSSMRNSGIGQ